MTAPSPTAAFRFYLDEDVPKRAALIARRLGIDTVSTDDAGVLFLTRRLPRDPARVAHALADWAKAAPERFGAPPLQAYLVDFVP